jgi:hypothetical protein
MLLDKINFEEWMRRILERLDKLENKMQKPEKPEKPEMVINGERLLDNTDLCFMLNCSKRTLQRFRVAGLLPCKRINQKTYYLESDVMKFIQDNLQNPKGEAGK